MFTLENKLSLTKVAIMLTVLVACLLGYELANVWASTDVDDDTLYTVPGGKHFLLYGAVLAPSGNRNSILKVNGEYFLGVHINHAFLSHRFDPPFFSKKV